MCRQVKLLGIAFDLAEQEDMSIAFGDSSKSRVIELLHRWMVLWKQLVMEIKDLEMMNEKVSKRMNKYYDE